MQAQAITPIPAHIHAQYEVAGVVTNLAAGVMGGWCGGAHVQLHSHAGEHMCMCVCVCVKRGHVRLGSGTAQCSSTSPLCRPISRAGRRDNGPVLCCSMAGVGIVTRQLRPMARPHSLQARDGVSGRHFSRACPFRSLASASSWRGRIPGVKRPTANGRAFCLPRWVHHWSWSLVL